MDVYEAIAARRTIRDFAPREVSMELVKKIIAAGLHAPTNDHLRSWHFVLLQEQAQRKALLDQVIKPVGGKGAQGIINRWGLKDESQREMYMDAIPKQYSMLYNAGVLMLPCFRQPAPLLKPKDLSALNYFASIWLCIENMLLAAAAEGVLGVVRIPFEAERKTMRQFVGLPDDYEIPCYLALGYPAEGARGAGQVEINLDERIHLGTW